MVKQDSTEKIRGYCAQCASFCPTVSYVRDGVFVEVKPDEEHPNACPLCPKGLAGPELVYSKQRLQYPIRRTRPRGDPNPGWERITWDEALDTIATKLNEVKAKWGAEAVVVARSGIAGSPLGDVSPWLFRLAYAFGTPNTIGTTHICQWHRDFCSSYTWGKPGTRGTKGEADYEQSACILIWGVNLHATHLALLRDVKRGLERGAKLIVIDPRRTEIADMADLWLQVQPGTDGALALSMINVMIEENLYDYDFVRDWTTAPFLVRSDTGNLLKASDLTDGGDPSNYVIVDSVSKSPRPYIPGIVSPVEPTLDSAHTIKLASGKEVECKTAFRLLRELVAEHPPSKAEALTGVPEDKLRAMVRMFATTRPACWYSFNGPEQSINASQTNRAICIFYALTGNYDTPGGNVLLPLPPVNPIEGRNLLNPEMERKRLGFKERPLGPAGTVGYVRANDVYKAILQAEPYPVKAILGFGGNLIMTNPASMVGREAVSKLDFHAQCELFLTPTAQLADIVLPAATFWESWHVRTDFRSLGARGHIQLRPPVVPPQHESRPDMKVMFELAKRLGLGDKFWDGDIEATFNYHLAPSNVTVEQLRMNPGGITLDLPAEYKKYSKKDGDGKFIGFGTPSGRVEIYSQIFKDHGHKPLPAWEEPIASRPARTDSAEKYPLILIGSKLLQYCHSQHRALPSLRKAAPHPFLEINPVKAGELGCRDGDWVILETPYGSITVQAKLTDTVPYNVICTQEGWWQECQGLNLPGYDPYSPDGANANLLYSIEEMDPLSGSLPIKGYPCNVRRK